jgi:sulfur-oxidizing protein SoxY
MHESRFDGTASLRISGLLQTDCKRHADLLDACGTSGCENKDMRLTFNRRQTLALGAGVAAVAMFGAAPALAKNDADEAIKKFTGGKVPVQGKVKLDLPEIAENGNTVPMTVTVESPMTAQSHVTDVLIVANENPRSGVVTFHFSPASGVAEANTRIRLAATQDVIAVAKMNDGSVFMASKQVKVTIGGCGG